jgi:hypothetical protein
VREAAGVDVGDMVAVRIRPDTEPRVAEVPAELAVVLRKSSGLRAA